MKNSVFQLIVNMAKDIQKYKKAYEREKKKREELEEIMFNDACNRLRGNNLYG
ncbi:hypothetical protein [Sulfurimonas sp.]|uniref:hypothetical protein n=1 Tax=Sulfurimonas sp. TaxID=2022749 RepID=UPI0025EFEF7C|nr:hypothetical protein [Sulfurimonas sp.]